MTSSGKYQVAGLDFDFSSKTEASVSEPLQGQVLICPVEFKSRIDPRLNWYLVDSWSVSQIQRPLKLGEIVSQCQSKEVYHEVHLKHLVPPTIERRKSKSDRNFNSCSFQRIDEDEKEQQSSPVVLMNNDLHTLSWLQSNSKSREKRQSSPENSDNEEALKFMKEQAELEELRNL